MHHLEKAQDIDAIFFVERYKIHIQAIALLHNFIVDSNDLSPRYGQPANINAHGKLDGAELLL